MGNGTFSREAYTRAVKDLVPEKGPVTAAAE